MGLLLRIKLFLVAISLVSLGIIAASFLIVKRREKMVLHSSGQLREADGDSIHLGRVQEKGGGDEPRESFDPLQQEIDYDIDDLKYDKRGRIIVQNELKDELRHRLSMATNKKLIVVWHPEFGSRYPVDIYPPKCGNCELTYDRNKTDDPRTGAVVFHYNALITDPNNMPKTRNHKQLWIYWVLESPYTVKFKQKNPLVFEDTIQFNATLSYRRDSDFYMSYEKDSGTIEDIVFLKKTAVRYILKHKIKLGITYVSNCGNTHTATWIRYLKLREIIEIDNKIEGFGGCFRESNINGREEIFRRKIRQYKFYFAFENSFHCKDYITEKFFHNALKSLTVPVVWGPRKEDYLEVIPERSFIHADDFSSMSELVRYLRYLDGNDTAYMEYFRWLTMDPKDMPQYGRARSWCQICRALHGINIDDMYNPKFSLKNLKIPLFTNGIAKRTVPSLSEWFYGEENPECFYDWATVMLNKTLERNT